MKRGSMMLETGYKFRDVSCIFIYFLVGTQAAESSPQAMAIRFLSTKAITTKSLRLYIYIFNIF